MEMEFLFINFKEAFDFIRTPKLIQVLKELGKNSKLRWLSKMTEEFLITRGLWLYN